MYFLKKIDGQTAYYLLEKKQYVIGRKNSDILIENDKSISRHHATITYDVNGDKWILKDLQSTYHTFYNNQQLTKDVTVVLQDNSIIRFGALESIFRFENMQIITTTSRLSNTEKLNLNKCISSLNGKMINNWTNQCTHLTAEQITLTLKVLHALVDNKPIVTSKYWEKFAENVKNGLPPPDVDQFKPPLVEALLNKVPLDENQQRKCLFQNKVFIFTDKASKEQMGEIIQKAGGKIDLWDKTSPLSYTNEELLLMQCNDSTENENLCKILKQNSKFGKRTIPLQEIAMSIILCSCEKDCNPNFNREVEVFGRKTQVEVFKNTPIAFETQSQDSTPSQLIVKQELIIPETLESEIDAPIRVKKKPAVTIKKENDHNNTTMNKFGSKRPNSVISDDNPFKKIKTEKESTVNTRETESASSSSNGLFFSSFKQPKIETTTAKNPFASDQLKLNTLQSNCVQSNSLNSSNIRKSTESIKEENPPKRQRRENIFSSTQKENVANALVVSQNISQISPIPSNSSTSVSQCDVVDSKIKQEFDNIVNISLIKVIKSKLVIKQIEAAVQQRDNSLNDSGSKNFKKFKKQTFKKGYMVVSQ